MASDRERRRLRVIDLYQRNAILTQAEIAKDVKVGAPHVSTILSEARDSGAIKVNKAILDHEHFGLSDLFFVQIKLHNDVPHQELLEALDRITKYPNVQEVHRTASMVNDPRSQGTAYDILIKLRCHNNNSFRKFIDHISQEKFFDKFLHMAATDTFKETSDLDILPVEHVGVAEK